MLSAQLGARHQRLATWYKTWSPCKSLADLGLEPQFADSGGMTIISFDELSVILPYSKVNF